MQMFSASQWKQWKKPRFHLSALVHLMWEPFPGGSCCQLTKSDLLVDPHLVCLHFSRRPERNLSFVVFVEIFGHAEGSLCKLYVGRVEFCIVTNFLQNISVARKGRFLSGSVLSLHFYVLPLELPLVAVINYLHVEGIFACGGGLVLKVALKQFMKVSHIWGTGDTMVCSKNHRIQPLSLERPPRTSTLKALCQLTHISSTP